MANALDAVYAYWQANNQTSGGVPLIAWTFCCAWNWDARPFPTFPELGGVWGDAGAWATGNWLGPGRTALAGAVSSPDPTPGTYPTFPTLSVLGWSVNVRPRFVTEVASHASGRETRLASRALACRDIELTFEVLRADSNAELQAIAGFYAKLLGRTGAFWFAPPGLSALSGQALGVGDGVRTNFALLATTGGAVEPVQATSGIVAVYLNGVAQSVGWSLAGSYAPGIVFATPPGAGVAVSADFGLLWLCRFAEDVADFENFAALLWRWRTVKLQTARP